MAQLSDDCFAFSGPLMRIEAAEALSGPRIQCSSGMYAA